jgi:two-component system, OmpR family, alkaline phosphatase synthesis response regulator PhoP
MTERIVVCDDEPHVIRAISLKFSRAGFEVQSAADAETAWELVQKIRPALLITDYSMPGLSGTDLVRRIRENDSLADLPVILLTAHVFDANESRELDDLDLSAIVLKPFSPRELVVQVHEILGYDSVPSTGMYRETFASP